VTVKADGRTGVEYGSERFHSIGDLLGNESTGGVGNVHALAARLDHDLGLRGEGFWSLGVGDHQVLDRRSFSSRSDPMFPEPMIATGVRLT
jgi:hypothetical protein